MISILKKRENLVRIFLFIACVGIAVGLCIGIPKDKLQPWAQKSIYYFMAATFILWVVLFSRWLGRCSFDLKRIYRKEFYGVASIIFVGFVTFATVKPFYRLLHDETNVLLAAKALQFDKSAKVSNEGYFYAEHFNPNVGWTEKRPYMYAFTLAMYNTVFGYDYKHAFTLNTIFLILMLIAFYVVARQFVSVPLSAAAVLLASSNPILLLSGTCAGIDMINSLLFVLAVLLFIDYVKNETYLSLCVLIATLLMFSHARYESLFLLGLCPLSLIALRKLPLDKFIKALPLMGFGLILLVPRAWQHSINKNSYENPEGVALMSLEHLWNHSIIFLKSLTKIDLFIPINNLCMILGMVGLIFVACRFGELSFSKKQSTQQERKDYTLLFIISGFFVANFVIMLMHWSGKIDQASQTRFFLNQIIWFSLLSILAIDKFFQNNEKIILGLSLFAMIYFLPFAQESRYITSLNVIRYTRQLVDFFEGEKDKDILIVSDIPGVFAAMNYGSKSTGNYNNNHNDAFEKLSDSSIKALYVVDTHPKDKTAFMFLGAEEKFDARRVYSFPHTGEETTEVFRITRKPEKIDDLRVH